MKDTLTYYGIASYFFASCAIGLEVLSVIFALMACFIFSRRLFYVIATAGILLDVFVASILSYIIAQLSLDPARASFDTYLLMLFYTWMALLVMMLYAMLRGGIFSYMMDKEPWDTAKVTMRITYIVQFLFPCTSSLLILIACATVTLWGVIYILWQVINWPLQYLIHGKKIMETVDMFEKYRILKLMNTTNITKTM